LISTSLAVALIALVGALVQGMSGFGFGLVCMALLPLLVPMDQAVPLVGAWGWTVNLVILLRLRGHLEWRRVAPMVGGAVIGIPLGIAFLRGADPTLVRAVLGLVIVSYSGMSLVGGAPAARTRPFSDGWGLLAGALGGALGGAFNTSGPPVIVYVSLKGWPKDLATASLQAFFVFSSTFAVAGFASVGMYSPQVVRVLLPVFPLVWLGTWLGGRIYDRVPQERFRTLVLALLLVLGLSFLWHAVRGG